MKRRRTDGMWLLLACWLLGLVSWVAVARVQDHREVKAAHAARDQAVAELAATREAVAVSQQQVATCGQALAAAQTTAQQTAESDRQRIAALEHRVRDAEDTGRPLPKFSRW
jgi:uncharacterized protein YlxW (UPF0749 family)